MEGREGGMEEKTLVEWASVACSVALTLCTSGLHFHIAGTCYVLLCGQWVVAGQL